MKNYYFTTLIFIFFLMNTQIGFGQLSELEARSEFSNQLFPTSFSLDADKLFDSKLSRSSRFSLLGDDKSNLILDKSFPSIFQEDTKPKWHQTKAFRISIAPASLFLAGGLAWNGREDIRDLRNRFIPTFEDHSDDLTQFIPALMVYGLNAFGVEGQHSVKRATTSLAIGGGMTAAVVTLMKFTTKVPRPDNGAKNSFPSGHTATAFTLATFLHKEYGQYKSPIYSIAGYGLATYTGIFRQLNNRHWSSDVLVGAGIGMLFTELGYVIADGIYKEKGLNSNPTSTLYDKEKGKPHFIGAKVGYAHAFSDITREKDEELNAQSGFSASVEGAYFFNNYIGIGAEFAISSFPLNSNNLSLGDLAPYGTELTTEPLGTSYNMLGAFFNYPASDKWAITGKLVGGYAKGANGKVILLLNEETSQELELSEVPIVEYNPSDEFSWTGGLSVRRMLSRNIGLNLYVDINSYNPEVTTTEFVFNQLGSIEQGEVVDVSKRDFGYWGAGLMVSAMFW